MATLGRLMHLVDKGWIDLSNTHSLLIDEADKMVSKLNNPEIKMTKANKFNDIGQLFDKLNQKCFFAAFSASYSTATLKLLKEKIG